MSRCASSWIRGAIAADACFYRGEVLQPRRGLPATDAYQRIMEDDRAARLRSQARLRRLQADKGGTLKQFARTMPSNSSCS